MSDHSTICHDGLNDESMLDSYAATEATVLEPGDDAGDEAGATNVEWTGARCQKCEAPLVSDVVSICRRCGWYGSLGQFVELDPAWESDPESKPATTVTPQLSHLQVWLRMLPRWSWVIIASVLVVMVESVLVRLLTPADSWIRTTWSLTQLTIGLFVAFGCHVFNFLVLAADDSEIGLLDLALKPLKLWMRAIEKLPARLWVANSAACGLAAALMSVLVIGGIPYDRLWDWGFKEPPKQNLMGAVMDQVQKLDKGDASGDLGKSIGDFAGNKADELTDKSKADPPKPRQNADCVILGYVANRDGRVTTLVLGTANRGKLIYAGNVAPKLQDDEMKALAELLRSIGSRRPILQIQYEATWVEPKYTCRVSFDERSKSGRLRNIEWDKMLGSIEKQ